MTEDPDSLATIPADPTRCYYAGCNAENELLLHVADEPWGGSDLCMAHARTIFESTPLCWTCECTFCERARTIMRQHAHPDGIALCPSCAGRHEIVTASGTVYTLDLDARTVSRSPGATENVYDYEAADMRRDGEALPLLGFEPIMIGFCATFVIGDVASYAGYVQTNRQTTPVLAVHEAG